MRVHYLQHVSFEGVGAIGDWAAARGHSIDGTPVFVEEFPHPGAFDLLVVMGGPMSVHDEVDHPWLVQEKQFIAACIEVGMPVLGVCLGAQLVADVLGGDVTRAPAPEIGWYPVTLTEAGASSAVFGRVPQTFDALHWHGDMFSIPPGAVRTATSAACPNQAFEYDNGRVVGVQFHLELTQASLGALAEAAAEDLAVDSPWVQTAEQMLRNRSRFTDANRLLFALLDSMMLASGRGA